MDIKVSVIIPVYNGEKYLHQCLDAVCGQTLTEIEIICVDDGSTDSSFEVLREYQDKDSRIQLYQQENLYAGAARNLGKSHASGEYLVFWDCDDSFEKDALEVMYNKASSLQADICICGANRFMERTNLVSPNPGYVDMKRVPDEIYNRKTNPDYILNVSNEAAWNKMFRRQFIEDINLDFQCVRNGNDVYFTVNALCLAERITVVNQPLLTYRVGFSSDNLVSSLAKSPLTPFQAWMDAADNLIKLGAFPERSFANKGIASVIYLLRNMSDYDAFCKSVDFLKNGGLDRMHLQVREPGYYYTDWYNDFIKHMHEDDLNGVQTYLSYMTYQQLLAHTAELRISRRCCADQRKEIKRLSKENDKLSFKLEETLNSWSFKIGRVVVWLPGKIKYILRKKDK